MAITPRTIFSSAAPATVAAASLLAFTAAGTVAYMSSTTNCQRQKADRHQDRAAATVTACEGVRAHLGDNQARWSEGDWARYATCFENHGHSQLTIEVASEGLEHYPRSEYLYNMVGYHQITLDRHAEAVQTLTRGLHNIDNPYSGVLQNNLAWAGLWAPREVSLDESRRLYTAALEKEPRVCAYIHTGLWVEYAKAKQASGVEKFVALRRFENLRRSYEPCLDRLAHADWKTVTEVAGAATLFDEIDETSYHNKVAPSGRVTSGDALLAEVAQKVDDSYSGVSVDDLCSESMPVATTHHLCTEKVGKAIRTLKAKQKAAVKRAGDAHSAGGGGGGGCPSITY